MGPDKVRQFLGGAEHGRHVERQLRLHLHPPGAAEVTITADEPAPPHRRGGVRVAAGASRALALPGRSSALSRLRPGLRRAVRLPAEGVWIQHEGGHPFVADPNTVTYYNKGQRYRRQRLSDGGDHGEWYAVAPEAIADTLAAHDPAAIDRPDVPFQFTHGPSDPDSYLRQRLVFEHVSREADARSVVRGRRRAVGAGRGHAARVSTRRPSRPWRHAAGVARWTPSKRRAT